MTDSETYAEQARPASSQRTPEEARDALQEWFAARGPGAQILDLQQPEGNGMSSETLLAAARFGDEERRLVIRLAPRPESHPVFPDCLDQDWRHGVWQGEDKVEGRRFRVSELDRNLKMLVPIEYLAKCTVTGPDGVTTHGEGLFEFGAIGPHQRYGFTQYVDPAG